MPNPSSPRPLPVLALAALLQACVFVPTKTQIFDRECQVVANRMVLESVQIAAIQHCANEACVALVVAAGVTAAASAVISGTIVVVGNVAYWFEKRARCLTTPTTAVEGHHAELR